MSRGPDGAANQRTGTRRCRDRIGRQRVVPLSRGRQGGGEGISGRPGRPERAVRRQGGAARSGGGARLSPAQPAASMWGSGNPGGGGAGVAAATVVLSGTRDCFLHLPAVLASHLRLQQVPGRGRPVRRALWESGAPPPHPVAMATLGALLSRPTSAAPAVAMETASVLRAGRDPSPPPRELCARDDAQPIRRGAARLGRPVG